MPKLPKLWDQFEVNVDPLADDDPHGVDLSGNSRTPTNGTLIRVIAKMTLSYWAVSDELTQLRCAWLVWNDSNAVRFPDQIQFLDQGEHVASGIVVAHRMFWPGAVPGSLTWAPPAVDRIDIAGYNRYAGGGDAIRFGYQLLDDPGDPGRNRVHFHAVIKLLLAQR